VTVVQLEAARRQLRPSCWRRDEKTELMRLYAAVMRQCGAADFEFGVTDRCEPQFYILDDNPSAACLTCISRLSKDSKPWYVIEDGSGGLLSEGPGLRSLVERASQWRGWGGSLLLALAAQLEFVSSETMLWWSSQFLAFG
jgi:hypothetical protein